MNAEHWLKIEAEQLRAQNAELRERLNALQADYATFALPGEEDVPLTPGENAIAKILFDKGGGVRA